MPDCQELIVPVLERTLDAYEIRSKDDHCKLITPFNHSFGDKIRFGIKNGKGDMFHLSDYGETFAMLELYGVGFNSEKQEGRLNKIQARYELEPLKGEISLTCRKEDLDTGILRMIGAIHSISDLLYTHKAGQSSQFKSKVEGFLVDSGYHTQPNYQVKGITQSRVFDFAINHRKPNVLLDTIHASTEYDLGPQSDSVQLNWHEIKEEAYEHAVIVDDSDGEYVESKLRGLKDSLDYFYKWTNRSDLLDDIPVRS